MPRWPDISVITNPSHVYGLVQIYTGWAARLQESIPAYVDLAARQIKLLECSSSDSRDLSGVRFRVYRTNTSVKIGFDKETCEFQIDHDDLEVIEQAWSKVKVKLLREKLSRPTPSRQGSSRSPRPKM